MNKIRYLRLVGGAALLFFSISAWGLVGTGLFDFGDQDGQFSEAQLQHVLGIAAADASTLYIADTYNHKIKRLDLDKQKITSVAGTGKPGKTAGPSLMAQLNEPGGIAMLGESLLIADTNNNRIMLYNREKRIISEWPIVLD